MPILYFLSGNQIATNTSRIANLLKIASIFMVLLGHYFTEYSLLWVPVTVGLVIFSFFSGFFTSIRYQGVVDRKIFWKNKFKRLGINLILINTSLLILFIYQNRTDLLTWHTVINILGLTGFLNWFNIDNISPYGHGVWFFTLLLVFYGLYPFLEKIKRYLSTFLLIFIIFAYYMNMSYYPGHELWITASGFLTGVWAGKHNFSISAKKSGIIACTALFAMVFFKFLNFSAFNFLLILTFSVTFLFTMLNFKLPSRFYPLIGFFTGCLLEIYLLHPYFFFNVTHYRILDFLISTFSIVILGKLLSIISSQLSGYLEGFFVGV